jgi:hypothetical protein
MLRGVATINYWTDDLAAARGWYAELVGVEPYLQRPGPDGRLAYVEFRIGDTSPPGWCGRTSRRAQADERASPQ